MQEPIVAALSAIDGHRKVSGEINCKIAVFHVIQGDTSWAVLRLQT